MKLHGSRKTLSDPSPTATQQFTTTKPANYPTKRTQERPHLPRRIANADGSPATQPIPPTRLTPTWMPYPQGHLRSPPTSLHRTRYFSTPQTDVSSPLSLNLDSRSQTYTTQKTPILPYQKHYRTSYSDTKTQPIKKPSPMNGSYTNNKKRISN